jgi:molecular chaperone GrpE
MESKEQKIGIKEEGKSNLGADFTTQEESQKIKHKVKEGEFDKIMELEKQNFELQDKVSELKDKIIRSLAELDNLKKRHQRELESTAKYAATALLKDLVEPFEQLFMALSVQIPSNLQNNDSFISILNGIEMTKKTFEKAFESHGLKRLYPKGEKFDHNSHQAVSQTKQDGVESGIIVNVVQAGYVLNERVIKPAMVVVSL